jgi:hypothetical protein
MICSVDQHSTTLKTQRLNNTDHTTNHRTDDTRINTALPWKLKRLNNTDLTKNHRTDDTRVNTALPWKLDWTTRTTLKSYDGWHKGQHSTTLKTQRLNNTDHTKNHRTDDTRVNTALPWKHRDWTDRKVQSLCFQGSAVLTLVSSVLWFLVWSVLFNLCVFRVVLCWPLCRPSYDF